MAEGSLRAVVEGEATWAIVHGDCREVLATLPDRSVDHVITDPPYDEHTQANISSGTAFKRQLDGFTSGSGIPRVDLGFAPLESCDFARDLVRVSRRWTICFSSIENIGAYRDAVGSEHWVRGGVWYKPNSMGQLTADRPASACEFLAIMHAAGEKRWNGKGSYAHWVFNGTRGELERHPCQKPLDLMLRLVEQFTDPGDVILDAFCGSAATGIAALRLGRRFIGIECDPPWVELARDRLIAETENSTVAARRAGQVALFSEVPQ
jgi:DNA modification methylase